MLCDLKKRKGQKHFAKDYFIRSNANATYLKQGIINNHM